VPLGSLFEHSRLAEDTGPLGLALLVLYAPAGLALMTVRLALVAAWILLTLPLPATVGNSRRYFKGLCWLTGTWSRFRNAEELESLAAPTVVVANHIYTFEAAAWLSRVPSQVMTRGSVAQHRIYRLATKFGQFINTDRPAATTTVTRAVTGGDRPLFCFPEGATSNGKVALFRFDPFVFALGMPVRPLAIRITRPLPIQISLLQARYGIDLLWALFVPWTRVEITVLPAQQRLAGENPIRFGDRIRQQIARELGVVASSHNRWDKARLRAGTPAPAAAAAPLELETKRAA
jgi:1-acyl-sn-glycerol-3-phosphate acyltransferase